MRNIPVPVEAYYTIKPARTYILDYGTDRLRKFHPEVANVIEQLKKEFRLYEVTVYYDRSFAQVTAVIKMLDAEVKVYFVKKKTKEYELGVFLDERLAELYGQRSFSHKLGRIDLAATVVSTLRNTLYRVYGYTVESISPFRSSERDS